MEIKFLREEILVVVLEVSYEIFSLIIFYLVVLLLFMEDNFRVWLKVMECLMSYFEVIDVNFDCKI